MKPKFASLLLLACAALSAGCAFTVHDVKVDYAYSLPIQTDLSQIAQPPMAVGEFRDGRSSVTNPRMIFHMTNLNGDTTTGGWQAEKPIADIIRDSIEAALISAKAPIVKEDANMVMEGELLGFDYDVIMGAWSGTLNAKMTLKLQVKSVTDGRIIWRDTLVGTHSGKEMKPAEVLRHTLDDLITDLLRDEYFQQQLINPGHAPIALAR